MLYSRRIGAYRVAQMLCNHGSGWSWAQVKGRPTSESCFWYKEPVAGVEFCSDVINSVTEAFFPPYFELDRELLKQDKLQKCSPRKRLTCASLKSLNVSACEVLNEEISHVTVNIRQVNPF